MASNSSYFSGFSAYLTKPMAVTFLFGISSGFPLTLVFSLMSGWLTDYGVSKSEIGLFALVSTAYLFKFIWSPLIDGIRLGPLASRFGHRRSWLFLLITLMTLSILALAQFDPGKQLYMVALLTLIVAILSASQDIVIDAYRIEIVDQKQLAHGSTMINFGYRTGNLIAGYFGFVMADYYGWSTALSILALMSLSGIAAALWMGEPKAAPKEKIPYSEFFQRSVVKPFSEFLTRENAFLILFMILFLKLGDAMADLMMTPFQKEMGFSNIEIADYSKFVGTVALMAGLAIGPFLYMGLGRYKALFISAILMMLTNLVFIWAFYQGHDTTALAVTVAAEKFATGVGSTIVVAYLSALCNVNFTATQYALLSALSGFGRTALGSSGGFIVDAYGWVDFFIITTIAALPGVILLYILYKKNPALSED